MRAVTKKWQRLLVACWSVLALAGCQPGAHLPIVPSYGVKEYRLGTGDQLRIITFGEDQLTGEFRVNDQGVIEMPLIGSLVVAGLTTSELDQKVSGALQTAKLIRNASVSTEVVAYRPIFVLGEVAKPGQYPYQPGMTLLTCVAIAGGFTYRAIDDYAEVVRTHGEDKPIDGKLLPDAYVAPGDVIKVLESRF